MLKVYAAKTAEPLFLQPEYFRLFSCQRKNKINRLANPSDKAVNAGTELLIRYAFNQNSIPFSYYYGEGGKPYIADSDMFFSISHSGEYSVCAICSAPVGVDIQVRLKYNERISKRIFCPEEVEALKKSENKEALFYNIWTAKESYVKATGEGISQNFKSFYADIKAKKIRGTGYNIAYISAPAGYTCCVCFTDALTDSIEEYAIDLRAVIDE